MKRRRPGCSHPQGSQGGIKDGDSGYAFAVSELDDDFLRMAARALAKQGLNIRSQTFGQNLSALRQIVAQPALLRSLLEDGKDR